MGLLTSAWQTRAEKIDLTHPKDPALARLFNIGTETKAGIRVDETTAANFSAYYCGIKVISDVIGMMPLITYRRVGDGKERATDHRLFRTLRRRSKPGQTACLFRSTLQSHALGWGNGYARIDNRPDGVDLSIITPDRVTVRDGDNGLMYLVTPKDGDPGDVLEESEVIHIRNLGGDGRVGWSVAHIASETIGLGLAAERYGAGFFGGDGVPGGVLKHPHRLGEEAQNNLRASMKARAKGGNKLLILEEAMEYQSIGIPPEDSQFLQTREFQVDEMARWFNLPPARLQSLRHGLKANVEQQSLDVLIYTMQPWLVQWEEEIALKLIPEDEEDEIFVEHLADSLLRTDTNTRLQSYKNGRESGLYSVNDLLTMENKNTIGPEGDARIVPMNFTNIKSLDKTDADGEATTEDLQQQALNGAQVTSMVEIAQLVASGQLPQASAKAMLKSAFPLLSEAQANDIVSPIDVVPQPGEPRGGEALLQRQMNNMVEREAKDAKRAAKTPDRFTAWCERQYAKKEPVKTRMLEKLSEFADMIPAERRAELAALIERHCESSHADMIRMQDCSTVKSLEQNVSDCVAGWSIAIRNGEKS